MIIIPYVIIRNNTKAALLTTKVTRMRRQLFTGVRSSSEMFNAHPHCPELALHPRVPIVYLLHNVVPEALRLINRA